MTTDFAAITSPTERRFDLFYTVHANGLGFQPLKMRDEPRAPFWLVLAKIREEDASAVLRACAPNATCATMDFIGNEFLLLSVTDYGERWNVLNTLHDAGFAFTVWTKGCRVARPSWRFR